MHILILEDDPAAVDAYRAILQKYYPDFSYRVAGTIAEAVRLSKNQHFDLQLIDYFLPDGEGLDFLSSPDAPRNCPTIIVTASPTIVEALGGEYATIDKTNGWLGSLREMIDSVVRGEDFKQKATDTNVKHAPAPRSMRKLFLNVARIERETARTLGKIGALSCNQSR